MVTDLPEGVPAPPQLPAPSYILADLETGDVLVAKGAHQRALPASAIKLLTAQVVAPRIKESAKTKSIDSDARVDGTRVGMVPGTEYTGRQLLEAVLLGSANDASEALARANGGLEPTLTQMNERAAQLGAKNTVAKNAHGLDANGQRSTVYDLVTILRGAMEVPLVSSIMAMKTSSFPGNNGRQIQMSNHNKLLWNYNGTIGGKDGFTDAAGHTYVGAVKRDQKTYAVAFLGAKSNDWKPTGKLLDWAFAHGSKARSVGALPAKQGTTSTPTSTPEAEPEQPDGDGPLAAVGMTLLWVLVLGGGTFAVLRVRKLRKDARRRDYLRNRRERVEARTGALSTSDASPDGSTGGIDLNDRSIGRSAARAINHAEAKAKRRNGYQ